MVMITILTKLMITMVTEMMMMTIPRIRLKKQIFISKAGAIYLGIVMTSCTYHCSDHHHPHDHGLPAYSHHDKIPPWWGNVSNDKGGNVPVSNSHHTP